jgi:hypothetical protein
MATEELDEKKIQENIEESLEELSTDEDVESELPEVDEAEIQASGRGWVPQEEYQGDPETWVPAKEFIAREPLYKALHAANRKIKKLEQTQQTFREHYTKVEQEARKRALTELQQQLELASDKGDIQTALAVKDKMTEVVNTPPLEKPVNTDFETWVEKNEWYNTDTRLKTFATGIGFGLANEHPDWSVAKVYEEVTKVVKEEFPQKFTQSSVKPKPNKVSSGTKTVVLSEKQAGAKPKIPSFHSLPEDARQNYRRLVKSTTNTGGILTHEEFMKDYMAIGGTLNNAE